MGQQDRCQRDQPGEKRRVGGGGGPADVKPSTVDNSRDQLHPNGLDGGSSPGARRSGGGTSALKQS